MLITKTVMIKWHPSNKNRYISKGYIYTKMKDEFKVKVEDLSDGSGVEIQCLCDYCLEEGVETIIEIPYHRYVKKVVNGNINKCCCEKCSALKYKDSIIKSYGVENISQLEEMKIKKENNSMVKYGVSSPMKTQEWKNKVRQTMNDRYGCDYPIQNEQIKNKIKNTNIEKYGYDNPMKNDIVLSKSEKTMLNKYGVKRYSQTIEYKEKSKQTSLDHWGTEYPMQNKEVQNKQEETMLIKYGFKSALQNIEIKAKAIKTLSQNGTCKTSTQQLEIFNTLKENNYYVELNYPLSHINLDVAIFINEIKIDLEYDGWNWHQDKQKDRKRDEFTKSQGWKILRIRSGHKIPSLEQIEEAINKLINSDRTFTQIILDDWKDIDNN